MRLPLLSVVCKNGRYGERRQSQRLHQNDISWRYNVTCVGRSTHRSTLYFLIVIAATTAAITSSYSDGWFTLFSIDTATISTKDQLAQVEIDVDQTTIITPTTPITASTIVYHEMRTDRSGSVIYDMLLAHAYAYALNTSAATAAAGATATYGGACYYNHYNDMTPSTSTINQTLIHTHQKFIHALGLSHILHFVPCSTFTNATTTGTTPRTAAYGDTENDHHSNVLFIQDRHDYLRYGTTRLWTTEWLQYIRSQQQQQQQRLPSHQLSASSAIRKKDPSKNEINVVVHIRRDDVSLCDGNTFDRYIPNSYYQTLLERYTDNKHTNTKYSVIIYSESNSTEPWSDFDSMNYRLKLDESPIDVWYAIMNADIVILSWSSFSIIPAIFNHRIPANEGNVGSSTGSGTIIYTPFWIKIPITTSSFENWIAMDQDSIRNMRRTKVRLRQEMCAVNRGQ